MKRSMIVLAVLAAAALAAQWALLSPDERSERASAPPSAAAAFLGPVAHLLASAQWVRVDSAFASGRSARAFALAERAIELDPGATQGWSSLVWYQAIHLAAPVREPDPERRRQWLENGLAVAWRGEQTARDPAVLARLAGDILFVHAEAEEPTPWPGGRTAQLLTAAKHYDRAAALGDNSASIAAEAMRQRAAALRR